MKIEKLEQALAAASAAFDRLWKEGSGTLSPEFWQRWEEAWDRKLALEAQLASAKNEPYAVSAHFPVKWDTGAPMPHLFTTSGRALLIFLVGGNHSDGNAPPPLALVEFHGCQAAKLGSPNDEVFHGHHLYGRGLQGDTVQIVHNSPWIAEIQAINKVHHLYNVDNWRTLKHYVFWFHDDTFECIAESFTADVFYERWSEIAARACERLLR